jgi:hypothetical protein
MREPNIPPWRYSQPRSDPHGKSPSLHIKCGTATVHAPGNHTSEEAHRGLVQNLWCACWNLVLTLFRLLLVDKLQKTVPMQQRHRKT